MRYSFEKTLTGGYQVRLNGQFVTYVSERDPTLVDGLLKEAGYNSREEFYEESVKESIRALKSYQ